MESFFDTKHLYRSYFKMALPVVLGLAVTLVYNLADTFFIAQTNDTNLIAGVSLCAPVFTTLMAFGNIYGQGGSSLISRMLGRTIWTAPPASAPSALSIACYLVAFWLS